MTPDFVLSEFELRHPDSYKWSNYPADVIPMWVADMDFRPAPSVIAALHARLDRTIGYEPPIGEEMIGLLRAKFERQGIADLPKAGWISFLPGVVSGLYLAVLGLTEVGDDVLTMTPIYPPFFGAIRDHGRNVRTAPLKPTDAGWVLDWAAMEAAVTPKTKLLLLCHPHNPTGRVWTREELSQLADFAQRHNLAVASDELHGDITLDGPFVPFAAVAPKALLAKTVTLTGPCKPANTAGLGMGAMLSHSPELITRLKKAGAGLIPHPNLMSTAMWLAALKDDGVWMADVLDYLRGNREVLMTAIRERLSWIRCTPPQATYLAWLDCRAHPKTADIYKHLLETAKVALAPGTMFGPDYAGYARLNFACSRETLQQAIDRLAAAGPTSSDGR